MIAMLCSFYKWTVEYCLDLNIKTFFAFHKAAIKMEAKQYIEALDIAMAPHQKFEVYQNMRSRYVKIINPEVAKLPERPSGPVFEAGSDEANEAMRYMALRVKAAYGYGR